MKHEPAARLLLDLLNAQTEDAGSKPLSLARLHAALTDGPPLTKAEQGVLYRSPLSRDDYLRLKRKRNAELQTRWRQQGLRLRLVAKAAADPDSDRLHYQNAAAGFQVTLFRQDDADMPWMVLLQLDPMVRDTLYPASAVVLSDSGGLEWARGRPDARGELSFGWHHPDTDPRQRLRAYTLTLGLS